MNGENPDRRRGNRVGTAVLAAMVVAAALVPWLGVGVVGAASCTTIGGGTTITEPGCYVISGSGADGDEEDSDVSLYVDVQVDDVVVDGNGNTVDGTGSGTAVRVDGTYSNVTVRNVTLTDWTTGVYVKDADGVRIEEVTVRSGGTGVTVDTVTNATVERVRASNNTDYGVFLKASPGGVLANVTAAGNTKSNVHLDSSDGATVGGATLTGGGAHGLFVKNSPNVSVAGVTAENASADGIHVYSSGNTTVRDALTRYVGGHGLYAENSPNVTVVGVIAEDLSLDGIRVGSSDGAEIRDSTARRTGQRGVSVADSRGNASVRNNTATNNTGHGFYVHHSDGSVVTANTARDNGAAGIRVSSELTVVRDNLFERNAHGVYLYKHSHVVENNTLRRNGYGVTLDGDNTTVAHNRVLESTTAGFRYVSGKDDMLYDNLFNNSKNTEYSTDPDPSNRWNVSARAGTNVLGGSVVAGNAWFDPSGDGHSELWDDADGDGIVDSNYTVYKTSVDERPLSAVDSALTVTPTSHDYGSVNLTSTLTNEFVVESRARPNVTVDRIHVEGPDALMFVLESDPAPVTLSTGETTTANVTFDPTVTGLLSANLGVEIDTTVVSGANATLTGEGLDGTVPAAEAGSNRTVDDGSQVSFDGTNSTDNVGIVSHTWDFGDGTATTGATVDHTFPSVGTYTVRLNVSDSAGNTDTDTATVTVTDVTAPTAEAGSNRTVDEGTPVAFDGTNSTDDVGVVSYRWEFDDGDVSANATTNHTFARSGTYTVTLAVTDAAGNRDTDTLAVTVESAGSDGGGDDGGDGGGAGGGGAPIDGATGEVVVAERTLLNETTTVGEPVLVRVALANYDPVRGLIELDLAANGATVAEREVAVAASTERTVYLRTTFNRAGRYDVAVNGLAAGTVEVIENSSDGGSVTPVSPPPEDLSVAVRAEGTADSGVVVRGVESNRTVPVEFGDDGPSADGVSLRSISFVPTEDDPITMNVSASREPLPGSPEFDRTDNTSGLAHLRVEHSIANEDVDGARIRFFVPTSRLSVLETSPDDVALYRYRNGSWAELPTRALSETDEGYLFAARSPGLSEFAAGAKQPQFELRTATVAVERIRVGDDIRVRVRITNTGGADGTYTAKLLLNESVVSERRLTIASNGTRQVLFSHEIRREGHYRVLVNGRPAGSVDVSGGAAGNGTVAVDPSQSGGFAGRSVVLGLGMLSVLFILGGLFVRRD